MAAYYLFSWLPKMLSFSPRGHGILPFLYVLLRYGVRVLLRNQLDLVGLYINVTSLAPYFCHFAALVVQQVYE